MSTRNKVLLECAKKHLFPKAAKGLKSFIETIGRIGIAGAIDSIPELYMQEMTYILCENASISDSLKESLSNLTINDLSNRSSITSKLGVSFACRPLGSCAS